MKRREFIAALGGAAASVSPFAARAQPPSASPTIGYLNSASANLSSALLRAFHNGLAEAGFVEGRNVAIEYRWAEGRYGRLPEMAAELVRRRVDVIFANGPAAPPAKAATATIPVVFTAGFDPIGLGLVSSLNRPGGNLTGVSILNTELSPKRLELLRELVPNAAVVALLVNPTNPNDESLTRLVRTATDALGLKFHVLRAATDPDLEAVFARSSELRIEGLVIGNDPFFTTRAELLAGLTLRNRLPAIYQYPEFTAAGGLLSYGASLTETYYKAGNYVGRVLKGEKPGDLPVEQSTKVELIINLKTAKTLGIGVPLPLLGRADAVIE